MRLETRRGAWPFHPLGLKPAWGSGKGDRREKEEGGELRRPGVGQVRRESFEGKRKRDNKLKG